MGTVLKPVVGTNVGAEAIKNPQPVDLQRIADVEVAGFEPAAFWSRTKRATKLRYTSMLEPMRGLEPLTC